MVILNIIVNMLTVIQPKDAALKIAKKAKLLRLAANYSRKTLAAKAGVTEASLKRFELTGEISFVSLLKLAFALDSMDGFENLLHERPNMSIEEIIAGTRNERQRGRR